MDHKIENQRNYGIDLLRIVSMLFVILLHCLGHGGVLENVGFLTPQFRFAWLLETAGYCTVNCYALISGYVGLNSRTRLSNLIMLWLQVAFYNVGFALLGMLWRDEGFVLQTFLEAMRPVSTRAYWYFSAYVGLFFFIPLFNTAVQSMEKKQLQWSLTGILLLFSVYVTQLNQDVFLLKYGYHALWLMILYLLGAYLRKYDVFENVRTGLWLLVYVGMVLLSWGVLLWNNYQYGPEPGKPLLNLVGYTSPTMVVAGAALLLFFSRLRIPKFAEKLIRFVSPLTFSVYLIHENALAREEWITGKYVDLAFYPIHRMLLKLGFVCVTLFAVCISIDYIRSLLFKWLHLKKLAELPEKLFQRKEPAHD